MTVQLSLDRVVVFAPDIAKARTFFGEVLGLRITLDEDRTLSFKGPDFALSVFACEESATDNGNYSQRAGTSVAFAVPSLEVAMSELSARGVRFLHAAPKTGPVGRYVAFTDPFGTVFELVEQKGVVPAT